MLKILVKYRKVFLLLIVMGMVLMPSAAFAGTPQDAAAPSIPDLFDSSHNSSPYLTDYQGGYYLDDTAGMFSPVENAMNSIANLLFYLQQGLCYLIIIAFYYAFNFSFFDIFKPIIESVVKSMQNQVFNQLSVIILSFLGIYYFIKTIQKQQAQFFQTLVYTVIVMACAIYYFTHPVQILQGVDDFTTNVSKMVLQGSNDGNTPNNDAVVKSSNDIWEIFVHRPWEYLEFGDKKLAKDYGDQVLRMTPESDERIEVFERLENNDEWANMGLQRIGFELMYLIPMLVTFVILAALCLLSIGYQFLTMLIFLMGIFIFILALIPGNSHIVVSWIQRLFSAAFTKIILAFVITLMVAFNKALFAYANSTGWLVMLILQLIIYVMIYFKRDEIIELFMLFKVAMVNPGQAANRMMAKVGDSNFLKERSSMRSVARRFLRSDKDTKDTKGTRSRSRDTSQDIDIDTRPGRNQNFTDIGEVESGGYVPGRIKVDSGNAEFEQVENQGNSQEHDLKALLNKAEKILEKQVEILKTEAERKAQASGKPVEYPSEVKRAENRRLMGLQPFDRREVAHTARQVQRIERAGGDPDELLKRPAEKKEVQRPANVISIMQRMDNRRPLNNSTGGGGFYGTDSNKPQPQQQERTGTDDSQRPTNITKIVKQEQRQEQQQERPQQQRERPQQIGVRINNNPNKNPETKKLRG